MKINAVTTSLSHTHSLSHCGLNNLSPDVTATESACHIPLFLTYTMQLTTTQFSKHDAH